MENRPIVCALTLKVKVGGECRKILITYVGVERKDGDTSCIFAKKEDEASVLVCNGNSMNWKNATAQETSMLPTWIRAEIPNLDYQGETTSWIPWDKYRISLTDPSDPRIAVKGEIPADIIQHINQAMKEYKNLLSSNPQMYNLEVKFVG